MTRDAGSGIIHSFLVKKKLPPSLPVPLQEYGQRDMVYQAVFSLRQPSYVVHTHTLFPETEARPPPHAGDVPFPIPTLLLPCVSLPASGSRWG